MGIVISAPEGRRRRDTDGAGKRSYDQWGYKYCGGEADRFCSAVDAVYYYYAAHAVADGTGETKLYDPDYSDRLGSGEFNI